MKTAFPGLLELLVVFLPNYVHRIAGCCSAVSYLRIRFRFECIHKLLTK